MTAPPCVRSRMPPCLRRAAVPGGARVRGVCPLRFADPGRSATGSPPPAGDEAPGRRGPVDEAHVDEAQSHHGLRPPRTVEVADFLHNQVMTRTVVPREEDRTCTRSQSWCTRYRPRP